MLQYYLKFEFYEINKLWVSSAKSKNCLLYTSDAADERSSVDLGGRRIIKKKNTKEHLRPRRNSKQKKTQHDKQSRIRLVQPAIHSTKTQNEEIHTNST